jgi:hypothetical protein
VSVAVMISSTRAKVGDGATVETGPQRGCVDHVDAYPYGHCLTGLIGCFQYVHGIAPFGRLAPRFGLVLRCCAQALQAFSNGAATAAGPKPRAGMRQPEGSAVPLFEMIDRFAARLEHRGRKYAALPRHLLAVHDGPARFSEWAFRRGHVPSARVRNPRSSGGARSDGELPVPGAKRRALLVRLRLDEPAGVVGTPC